MTKRPPLASSAIVMASLIAVFQTQRVKIRETSYAPAGNQSIVPLPSPTPTTPKPQLPFPVTLNPPSYPQDRSGRVFTAKQVDRKAAILAKPEANLTEAARWHNTFGTVIVHVVLAANGKVTGIKVVKGLRDGLNENAMAAARQIEFRPAIRRGLFVATSMKLEYNFNPY